MQAVAIGVDVGGTGIKGAAVDPGTGERLSPRFRVETPTGGSPADIAHEVTKMVAAIRDHHAWEAESEISDAVLAELDPNSSTRLPIGITLPGVVREGIMLTAANVDTEWIGTDASALFAEAIHSPCTVVNDADAAGVAESAFGAAAGLSGMTMVLTFGTGIGSACIYNGVLVPNFELGHLQLGESHDIEQWVSPKNIEAEGISLQKWAERAADYVRHLEHVLNPDRFVIGGSISKDSQLYLPFSGVSTPLFPAHFRNDAGIVGAAALAAGTAR